jgi:OOP family OmpA-OmpF porin
VRKLKQVGTIAAVALVLMPGCALSPAIRQRMLLGAATGAVFSGAAACGAAAAVGSSNPNAVAIACPVGIVGGALVGGAIGYLTAYSEAVQESQVPPPPPVMAQQSVPPSSELAQQQPAAPPPAAVEAPPPAPTQMPATSSPTPSATPSSTPAPTSPPPGATPVAPTPAPVVSVPPTPAPLPPTAAAPIPTTAATPFVVAPETVELRGVFFTSKSWDLTNAQKRALDAAVDTLKQHPNLRIYVKGYSDSRGSAQLNQKLSQERAASVAAYLASKGIPLSQMIVVGMGSTHPLASNATAAGRALNRRVEFEPVLDEP